MTDITIRPLADEDVSMLEHWYTLPHVHRWFSDTGDWLGEVAQRHDKFAWVSHFIVMAGEKPIGFCQYYDCFDAKAEEDWPGEEITARNETYSIDYFIGETDYVGKGYGKALIKLLTDTILGGGMARRIIVQPDSKNQKSQNVLLANGYTYIEQWDFYEIRR